MRGHTRYRAWGYTQLCGTRRFRVASVQKSPDVRAPGRDCRIPLRNQWAWRLSVGVAMPRLCAGRKQRYLLAMKVDGKQMRTIWVESDGASIGIINQTLLPHRLATVRLTTVED